MDLNKIHDFHIPVLGTGFSIDTAVKVSMYGISSVISLVDDELMEKMREHYLCKQNLEYKSISDKEEDARARRITSYLNVVNDLVNKKFSELKNSNFEKGSLITNYFEMLPENSSLKHKYHSMLIEENIDKKNEEQNYLRKIIKPGSIDVNIMTKLDKANYKGKEKLSNEFNDAHAALRGFANSDLSSGIVFSAGMNPRLYSYMENFEDFYQQNLGEFKKKIIIKVSDYRSALIQGKFLANKGLWVSEYRIESGLNCGGHAFATDGLLLGPILEEFKTKKEELHNIISTVYDKAMKRKEKQYDSEKLKINVTVQGGVGNSKEQEFLIRNYGVHTVGWGSPFLLVPEVINIDDETLKKLSAAKEDDFYLSKVSPLGVPFNNLRNSGKELEKQERIEAGKPGSACPKKFLQSNLEYSDQPICTASITYLNKKIKTLKDKYDATTFDYKKEFDKAVDKVCLCVGLAASALEVNKIEVPKTSKAVAVCPGPNLAYFSKVTNLKEMVDHIYGRINLVTDPNRPNMFVKELQLYIDYLIDAFEESIKPLTDKTETFLKTFHDNLTDGIKYYKNLLPDLVEESAKMKEKFINDIEELEEKLLSFSYKYLCLDEVN